MSDLSEADRLEQLGDTAESRDAATAFYRKAQMIFMPAGVLWTAGEEYDRRMQAFERIQQKLYGLSKRAFPNDANPPARWPETPPAAVVDNASQATVEELSVSEFCPGLVLRIERSFVDFDGQEI